jgi:hypothetical protein
VASNDQKTVLPRPHIQRGQSKAEAAATIIVNDAGNANANDNAQIIVTHLPKASSSTSKTVQQIAKSLSSASNVTQSTSGAMTGGVEEILKFKKCRSTSPVCPLF